MAGLEWMGEALCREVDFNLFFPEDPVQSQQARRVCSRCPVRQDCLTYALENPVWGVWGGTTLPQRQKMRGAAYRQLAS